MEIFECQSSNCRSCNSSAPTWASPDQLNPDSNFRLSLEFPFFLFFCNFHNDKFFDSFLKFLLYSVQFKWFIFSKNIQMFYSFFLNFNMRMQMKYVWNVNTWREWRFGEIYPATTLPSLWQLLYGISCSYNHIKTSTF